MASADTLLLNVCALLPVYVALTYPNCSSLKVGLLMACYPLSFLVTAPCIGSYMEKLGRKNSVFIGMLVMALATLTFGLASLIDDFTLFFAVSAVARILQGMGDSSVSVAIPGIITVEFPDKQERYLSYYNMAIGIGTCSGPLIGSLLYNFVSYGQVFYIFAA